MDPRKELPFLFCDLGLCSEDNGAKKRTHSFGKNGFGVRFLGSAPPTSSPPDRQEKLNGRLPERTTVFVLRVRP